MKLRLIFFGKLVLVSLFLFISILFISILSGTASGSGVALAAHPVPTPTPAPSPPPGTPWLLENYSQQTCLVAGSAETAMTTYYGVWINGTWKQPINVRVTNTPAGTQFWSYQTPIPAGSSRGIYSLAVEAVQVPSNTPIGTYTLQLAATDGKLQQSVPVTLSVQTTCGRGY
jgi:hypothetical protein